MQRQFGIRNFFNPATREEEIIVESDNRQTKAISKHDTKKHYDEIILWAIMPEGTKVWCKRSSDKNWILQSTPSWLPQNDYVVNDDKALDRMKEIDACRI